MMSENLSFFLGFAARDLVNSENLSYFPGFMLIGDRDCVSFCHFRLSRTPETLPYFPGYVMMRRYDSSVLFLFHKTNWCDSLNRGIGATIWSHQFQISEFCYFSFKRGFGATI